MSLLPIVALIWFLTLRQERKVPRNASTAPILVLVFLVLELIALGVIGRYPFGGEVGISRSFSLFVLLSGFQGLDRFVTFLRLPLIKKLVLFFTSGLDNR